MGNNDCGPRNRDALAFLTGTSASVLSSVVTLHFFYSIVQRQVNFEMGAEDLIKKLKSKEGHQSMRGALSKVIKYAALKSMTELGVVNLVLQRMKNETSPYRKGAIAGFFAGFSQAIITTPISQPIISEWANKNKIEASGKHLRPLTQKEWIRCYQAGLLKNTVDKSVSMMAVLAIRHYFLENNLMGEGSRASAAAGLVGPALVAPIVMPFVTLETRVFSNPVCFVSQQAKYIYKKEGVSGFYKGLFIRGSQKSIQTMIGFGAMDAMDRWSKPCN